MNDNTTVVVMVVVVVVVVIYNRATENQETWNITHYNIIHSEITTLTSYNMYVSS